MTVTLPGNLLGAAADTDNRIRTSSTQTDTFIGLRTVIGTDFSQKYADNVSPVLIFRTPEQQQKLTSGKVS